MSERREPLTDHFCPCCGAVGKRLVKDARVGPEPYACKECGYSASDGLPSVSGLLATDPQFGGSSWDGVNMEIVAHAVRAYLQHPTGDAEEDR